MMRNLEENNKESVYPDIPLSPIFTILDAFESNRYDPLRITVQDLNNYCQAKLRKYKIWLMYVPSNGIIH